MYMDLVTPKIFNLCLDRRNVCNGLLTARYQKWDKLKQSEEVEISAATEEAISRAMIHR
jgi:hypothetical protein